MFVCLIGLLLVACSNSIMPTMHLFFRHTSSDVMHWRHKSWQQRRKRKRTNIKQRRNFTPTRVATQVQSPPRHWLNACRDGSLHGTSTLRSTSNASKVFCTCLSILVGQPLYIIDIQEVDIVQCFNFYLQDISQ